MMVVGLDTWLTIALTCCPLAWWANDVRPVQDGIRGCRLQEHVSWAFGARGFPLPFPFLLRGVSAVS